MTFINVNNVMAVKRKTSALLHIIGTIPTQGLFESEISNVSCVTCSRGKGNVPAAWFCLRDQKEKRERERERALCMTSLLSEIKCARALKKKAQKDDELIERSHQSEQK